MPSSSVFADLEYNIIVIYYYHYYNIIINIIFSDNGPAADDVILSAPPQVDVGGHHVARHRGHVPREGELPDNNISSMGQKYLQIM